MAKECGKELMHGFWLVQVVSILLFSQRSNSPHPLFSQRPRPTKGQLSPGKAPCYTAIGPPYREHVVGYMMNVDLK